MFTQFEQAAKKYLEHKKQFAALLECVGNNRWAIEAANSHVRKRFRSISNDLTHKVGADYESVGSTDHHDIEIDHAVPLALVHDYILENHVVFEELVLFLKNNVVGVRLTRDEHRTLNKTLKSKMPNGWKFGDDVLARYTSTQIQIRKV